jgi:hypothetical protein
MALWYAAMAQIILIFSLQELFCRNLTPAKQPKKVLQNIMKVISWEIRYVSSCPMAEDGLRNTRVILVLALNVDNWDIGQGLLRVELYNLSCNLLTIA